MIAIHPPPSLFVGEGGFSCLEYLTCSVLELMQFSFLFGFVWLNMGPIVTTKTREMLKTS